MWINKFSPDELDRLLTGPLTSDETPVAGRLLREALTADGITPGVRYFGGGCWVFTVPADGGGELWITDGMVRLGHPVERHTGWTVQHIPDPGAEDPEDGAATVYAAPDDAPFADDTATCAEAVRTRAA
ncbi:hypothetical protein ACFWA9_29220 [Kitasatospora sp. NPDC059973]|uniref:hypothetical protein n=1 Tax=Kitasatospora sp. NPDC059973 TaxID=3347020 RepID=UPI0036C966CF